FRYRGVHGRLRAAPFHGGNRGSSPLGRANKIKCLGSVRAVAFLNVPSGGSCHCCRLLVPTGRRIIMGRRVKITPEIEKILRQQRKQLSKNLGGSLVLAIPFFSTLRQARRCPSRKSNCETQLSKQCLQLVHLRNLCMCTERRVFW